MQVKQNLKMQVAWVHGKKEFKTQYKTLYPNLGQITFYDKFEVTLIAELDPLTNLPLSEKLSTLVLQDHFYNDVFATIEFDLMNYNFGDFKYSTLKMVSQNHKV